MIRATVPLLILVAAAGPAMAQQPVLNGSHTVVSGETLGAIAREYYGSASEWLRIFEANRDVLSDPDVVPAGVTLAIPDAGGSTTAQVTGVELRGTLPAQQELLSYQSRRQLLEDRPFQPIGVPELQEAERTVFFGVPDPGGARSAVVVLDPPELIPAFPASFFHSASWIVPSGDRSDRMGTIVALVGDAREVERSSAQIFGEVLIEWAGGAPQIGDEILTYEMGRDIEGVGELAIPSGRAQVTRVGDGEVVAQVLQVFRAIRVGQMVAAGRVFPLQPGVHPTGPGGGIEGQLVALEDEGIEVHIPGDVGFVDLGQQDGLALGDVLVGLADEADDWTGQPLAYFQVVGLSEGNGAVRLVSTVSPKDVRPGLRVVVDRKMP